MLFLGYYYLFDTSKIYRVLGKIWTLLEFVGKCLEFVRKLGFGNKKTFTLEGFLRHLY